MRTRSRTVITHLRPRLRRRLHPVPPRQHAGQGRPADADLGAVSGRLARGRRARQHHRRSRKGAPMTGLPQSAPAFRPPEPAPVPKTLADRLRMQISDDIVRGELAPGATLDEMELARRFKVSRTPVREAIRLLASSGLVEARPHRSAVVARPDRPQLTEMFEALRELEALCAGPRRRAHDAAGARRAAADPTKRCVAAVRERRSAALPRDQRGISTQRSTPAPTTPTSRGSPRRPARASPRSAARSSAPPAVSPSRTPSTGRSSTALGQGRSGGRDRRHAPPHRERARRLRRLSRAR